MLGLFLGVFWHDQAREAVLTRGCLRHSVPIIACTRLTVEKREVADIENSEAP